MVLNLKELRPVIIKEEYCIQNCSASDPMSVPSSLIWAVTHRVTTLTEELLAASSLLADSGEEPAAERLISGMENFHLWTCPSTVWGRQRLSRSEGGISLMEISKVVSQIGFFSLVSLHSFEHMDTKGFL